MAADIEDLLSLAVHMADEAGKVTGQYFRSSFAIETKSDKSPVTTADRAIEKCLRQVAEEQRPDDGIIGEEYGIKDSKNNLDWVFDPIDGTKSFLIGRPTFGTLIALCEDGIPVIGIIDQPVSGERWIGAKGRKTTFNGQPVKTRSCANMNECHAASTSPSMIPDLWQKLYQRCNTVTWGGDCYAYGLLACGWIDFVVESQMNIYDYAALVPVVEGAGGIMCDWDGKPLSLSSGNSALAVGDPALKEEALAFVKAA